MLAAALAVSCSSRSASPPGPPAPPPPPIRVSPAYVTLAPGASARFTVTRGGTVLRDVSWSASGGTIDPSGVYTAPAGEEAFTITARRGADTGSAGVVVAAPRVTDPAGLIPDAYATRWSPGIPGGVPTWTNVHTTIRAATYGVTGTTPAGASAAINAALAAAAAVATPASPQVVLLEEGTYRITAPIVFDHHRYVVLRGAGPDRTRLRGDMAADPVIWFNGWPSGAWDGDAAVDVLGDVPKGATRIPVRDASGIQVGDVIQLDQLDDPSYVWIYDAIYFKRGWKPDWLGNGPLSSDGYRSVNVMLEVVGKEGNTLVVSAGRRADGAPVPFGTHIAFEQRFHPQVFVKSTTRAGDPRRTSAWCGVEELYVTGGTFNAIRLWNTSYSWIRHVELDGDPRTAGIPEPPGGYQQHFQGLPGPGGNEAPASLAHCFRCEVRDSYVHHTQRIEQGGSSYGIVLSLGTSNTLVENNVVVYFDKCVTAAVSGGGNVIAYNYVDNAYTNQRDWQEGAIDLCHEAFCHSDLAEGNWTAEMGAESTHGNTGFHVFFRNYANGANTGPTPEGTPAAMYGNLHAAAVTAWLREMAFAGNVLHQTVVRDGQAPVYEYDRRPCPAAPVWRIGDTLWWSETFDTTDGPAPPRNRDSDGVSAVPADDLPYVAVPTFTTRAGDKLLRHGNWDSVTGDVTWDPAITQRALPDSLYLEAPPAFFGLRDWPWVDPTAATTALRVKTLPARARYLAGRPNQL